MRGVKVYPKADDGDVTAFIKKTFEKRECNRFRRKATQNDTEFCDCGYSRPVHTDAAIDRESDQSEVSTRTLRTDAFGKLTFVEDEDEDLDWKTKPNNIQYIRLDHNTDASKILELFRMWKMDMPHIILSVISDSDQSLDGGETETSGLEENIKKMISSLVEAATSTDAWITTGGLDKGVDQLIGNEVKKKLANRETIPAAVLGISHWGSLKEKQILLNDSACSNGYASDSNPTGLSLNQHHTHFLLVDDGTQKKSSCECDLRRKVEFRMTHENERVTSRPLIYFLIGGSINAFDFIERALASQIPVIIAEGTGGAADIISRTVGPNLGYLPEAFETLFNQLDKLLTAGEKHKDKVRQAIANMKTKNKVEPFLAIIELLSRECFSENGEQEFIKKIPTLKESTTHELLVAIDKLQVSIETNSADSSHSATEREKIDRMRAVIEQMIVVNGIPQDKAKLAVSHLEDDVLNEILTKTKGVYTNLKTIRGHHQKQLLIRFDIASKVNKNISSLILDALKEVKRSKPCDLYMLAAGWDNERFFRRLLLENWMRDHHENVFLKLLDSGNAKYVKLLMENVSYSDWLTTPLGPLEEFQKNELCACLLEKINDLKCKEYHPRMKAKMLFIWCVEKQMPEAAMLFCQKGQDCLAMAVAAYRISKKQRNDLKDEEGYDKLEKQTQYFSKLALDILRDCYADNHQNAYDLLVGKVEDLDGETPLQIAVDADFKAFVSQVSVQKVLDKIWIKNIENYSKYKYVPLLLSGACPLFAPVLFHFRIPSDDSEEEQEIRRSVHRNEFIGSYVWKFKNFLSTPLVKFFYGFFSYIGYLLLFSIVMLSDFRGHTSPAEIVLTIWTFILIIEEVKQFILEKSAYKNEWNYIDIGALVTYVIGFILRMIYNGDPTICPDCLYVARIILAFSLLLFFFRTLQFLSAGETLGPKIYMLRGLVADLVSFMLILTVFISAYGVVSNVILYPNQPLNGKLLQDVFYDAWWSVILQFNREDALGLNCNVDNPNPSYISAQYCSNTSSIDYIDYVSCKRNGCPANNWIVSVLLAFYALLTVVMMLNILIVMFNATFSTINERQIEVSKMQRYRLVREFSSRSMVPPPLCVITYFYFIIKYLVNLCKDWHQDDEHSHRYYTGNKSGKGPMLSKSPPEAFAKNLYSKVRDWEHRVVEAYRKRNKDKEEIREDQSTGEGVSRKKRKSKRKNKDSEQTPESTV